MKYEESNGGIVLSGYGSFDIKETLECGQCFRFRKIGERDYGIVAFKKYLRVKQEEDLSYFSPCSLYEFESIWLDYFDLRRDYDTIKDALIKDDEVMRRAVEFGKGIRILNQDKTETIISFIISQNKQISGIKKIIHDLSQRYGEKLNGEGAYAFPDINVLAGLKVSDFTELKTGFRDKYLADAVKKIHNGEINLCPPDDMATGEIRAQLMKVNGIGPKVANCVLLFSFGRRGSFPVDVWVRRGVSDLYFSQKKITETETEKWAAEKFGEYGGYAQQYLFHYTRGKAQKSGQ